VEIVQAMADALNAGYIDAFIKFYAPSVEAYPDASCPEATPLDGRDEFRRWVEGIRAPWRIVRLVVHETPAVGPDQVLERVDFGGVGIGSGIETLASYAVLHTVRDGEIVRVDFFRDHDEALKCRGAGGLGALPHRGRLARGHSQPW
jgi:ketosteroid isomerase-like protein